MGESRLTSLSISKQIMKLVAVLGLILAFVAVAYSCTVATDCPRFTNCTGEAHMACIRHKCECHGDHELDCKSLDDCNGVLNCDKYHRLHCVDSKCQCQFSLSGLGK